MLPWLIFVLLLYTFDPSMSLKLPFKDGRMILAPLTRGGNKAFRKLVNDLDCSVSMSEMAYTKQLFQKYKSGRKREEALIKRDPLDTSTFGFQIATKSSDEAVRAAQFAKENRADWIDLNVGCPIYEASKRGVGAIMLKKPQQLIKMVRLTCERSVLPVTVKVRLGVDESNINVDEVVGGLKDAGAAAVLIHGRTMEQRYSRPNKWDTLYDIAGKYSDDDFSVIGNGDVLTHSEAKKHINNGIDSVLVGRGALIKPWIFKEFAEDEYLNPTAEERIAIYYQLASYFKSNFGADDFGKRHSFYFLPWHFNFFCRYRPLNDSLLSDCGDVPPIQNSRVLDDLLTQKGLLPMDLGLDRLLRVDSEVAHMEMATVLWDASSSDEAVDLFYKKLVPRIEEFERLSVDQERVKKEGMWEASREEKTRKEAWRTKIPSDLEKSLLDLEFRLGRVMSSKKHAEAEELVVNVVDMGTETRTIVTRCTDRDDLLVGKHVIVLCNLEHRNFFGVISQGMILYSKHKKLEQYAPISTPVGENMQNALGSLLTLREEPSLDNSPETLDTVVERDGGEGKKQSIESILKQYHGKYTSSSSRARKSWKRVKGLLIANKSGQVIYRTAGKERSNWQLQIDADEKVDVVSDMAEAVIV